MDIVFLRIKDKVARKLKQFFEFKEEPKVIGIDRKANTEIKTCIRDYFKNEGIKIQCTVGYALQQNGIAEGLSKALWAEALNKENHV